MTKKKSKESRSKKYLSAQRVASKMRVKKDPLREALAGAIKPLLTFEEVMTRVKKPRVLLGNGFSMSYDKDRFSFTTLLESAVKDGIIEKNSKLYRVFEKLATADFETVMRAMDNSKDIIVVYEGDKGLQEKLLRDSNALK